MSDEWFGSSLEVAELPPAPIFVERSLPTEVLAWAAVLLLSAGPALGYLLSKFID